MRIADLVRCALGGLGVDVDDADMPAEPGEVVGGGVPDSAGVGGTGEHDGAFFGEVWGQCGLRGGVGNGCCAA